MIFAILHFYNFVLVIDTTVQNNDEISLHFKPMRLILLEAETCCHLVTVSKINIHNTSCALTCETLLLICT
jgi:hypothetical protein